MMHTESKRMVLCLAESRAKMSANTQATTCVASSTTTWPIVSSPKSVPMLMQLSMMVPTPSMYRKKASRKKNTLRSFKTMCFMVRPILQKAARMGRSCGWV